MTLLEQMEWALPILEERLEGLEYWVRCCTSPDCSSQVKRAADDFRKKLAEFKTTIQTLKNETDGYHG